MTPSIVLDHLAEAQIALEQVMADADLQAQLAASGYEAARLYDGQDLVDAVRTVHKKPLIEAAFRGTRTLARRIYARHRSAALRAFAGEPVILDALGLTEKPALSLAGWLAHCRRFYLLLLTDAELGVAMALQGQTEAALRKGMALLDAVEASYDGTGGTLAEEERVDKIRLATQEALNAWVADLREMTRLALERDA